LLTTEPHTKTSSLGIPEAFQPFAKPGWLPASTAQGEAVEKSDLIHFDANWQV